MSPVEKGIQAQYLVPMGLRARMSPPIQISLIHSFSCIFTWYVGEYQVYET